MRQVFALAVEDIVTLDLIKLFCMTYPDNWDYITSVECISSGGPVIPPLIIISDAHVFHKWLKNNLDGSTLFTTSETGYSDNNISFDWFDHFIEHTMRKRHRV